VGETCATASSRRRVFAQGLWFCFVGVLVGTRRAAPAQRAEDPLTGRSADPAEVGKLHRKCSGQE
jgi:hypothetical protein